MTRAAQNQQGAVQPPLPEWMIADLRESGITPERAYELGWYPVSNDRYPELLGFSVEGSARFSDGYAIPYFDSETREPLRTPDGRPYVRVKLRVPVRSEGTKDGKVSKVKYLSPRGGGQHAYVLPQVHTWLRKGGKRTATVTEGEKKAVAATDAGLPWTNSADSPLTS